MSLVFKGKESYSTLVIQSGLYLNFCLTQYQDNIEYSREDI